MFDNNIDIDPENLEKGGFSTPDRYFEKSTQIIRNRVSSCGFETPEYYFEESKGQLIVNIPKLHKQKTIRLHYKNRNLQLIAGIAASAVMIAGFYLSHYHKPTFRNELSVITKEEIINYFVAQDLTETRDIDLAFHLVLENTSEQINEALIIDEL